MELSSSQSAKWKTAGPLPEIWLPWVAHVGLTITWLALYVHRLPALPSNELGVGVLAGALVWPAIGAGKLARSGGYWALVALGLRVGQFLMFSLYLPDLLRLAQ
jgi:hypothetical protein